MKHDEAQVQIVLWGVRRALGLRGERDILYRPHCLYLHIGAGVRWTQSTVEEVIGTGIHIRLRNEQPGMSSGPRIRSTYVHGFALLRSLLNRGILTDLYLTQVMFRGFSAHLEEPHINNEYSWLNREFDSDIDRLVSDLDKVRRRRKAQYPLFEPPTLETTVQWTARTGGRKCIGYVKMREPRADDAKTRGNIEADVVSISGGKSKKPANGISLTHIIQNRIKTDRMTSGELNGLIELTLAGPRDSRQFAVRSPDIVAISDDDEPFYMFQNGIAVGLRSIHGLAPLTYGTVSSLAKGQGTLPLYSARKHKAKLPEMSNVFETLSRGYLTRLLSNEHVQDDIMAGCEDMGVTVTTGSLIASASPSLEPFLFVVLEAYESLLNFVYDEMSALRRKLDSVISGAAPDESGLHEESESEE